MAYRNRTLLTCCCCWWLNFGLVHLPLLQAQRQANPSVRAAGRGESHVWRLLTNSNVDLSLKDRLPTTRMRHVIGFVFVCRRCGLLRLRLRTRPTSTSGPSDKSSSSDESYNFFDFGLNSPPPQIGRLRKSDELDWIPNQKAIYSRRGIFLRISTKSAHGQGFLNLMQNLF